MADRFQRKPLTTAVLHAVLLTLSAIFCIPLLWMISSSLKTLSEASRMPPVWIPPDPQWQNYAEATWFDSKQLGGLPPMGVYAVNTVILCLLVVAGSVVSNALVGYSFGRLRWPGRDFVFAATLATMMVPFPVLMVPLFGLFKDLGWVGTFRPLWIPMWFGTAFNIFLMRQFFRGIPFELSEAAKIDGCSEWQIFYRVILPLAKPALAVVALFSFMACWNDFLGPLLYLQSQKTFTLSLGLQAFRSQAGTAPIHLQMAASVMVVIPVIILFFFTQKQFIQGIATSGLKG